MGFLKKFASIVLSLSMIASVTATAAPVAADTLTTVTATAAAADTETITASFVQNTDTTNTLGFYDEKTDQFETYTTLTEDGLSSRIYKPVSGDVLIVTFHGNGEGGVDGNCNNYSQISANELAVAFVDSDIQAKFHGAYVLSFQAPHDWYHDQSDEAAAIINQAIEEFGIKQVFVAGLSAGGMMSERMIAKYPDMFDGALFSCAAISKNDTYVEGLGGDYTDCTEYLNETLKLKKPVDYDTYLANYDAWLEKIAASKTAIFMVQAKNDPTISSTWTEYAYNKISALRSEEEDAAPIYYNIIDTVNYGNSSYSEHFSWVKMLNNDIWDSTGTVRTMDFLTGLCTSENVYTEKEYTIPTAGAADAANTYKFNLIAEVQDSGEKIVKAVIDMNGDKVDASKLSADSFKVTATSTDASGLLNTTTDPVSIAVKDVIVNKDGNIELTFADQRAVLTYSMYMRNLTSYESYTIEPTELTIAKKTSFLQKTDTTNGLGFYDAESDQFENYTDITTDGISSKIYKPVSGDVLVVTFHGNGEGGVEGNCNNYAPTTANELGVAFIRSDIQAKFHGAYVLAFQTPHDWYHDMSEEVYKVIKQAQEEFGIKQIFISGLSAGGLMCQRMIAKYPDLFDGALYSCAAISKNDTYVEGLGGNYEGSTEYINETLKLKKPTDYDEIKANYDKWLESIASSKTAIFMVHAENDTTISSTWTKYAYEKLTALRAANGNTAPVYCKIIDNVNYGNTSYSQHFSWVKMLNNDILDSTGTVKTMDFLTGLCTSENEYQPKTYTVPTAGASNEDNTYMFSLIAEVQDSGQKIVKAVIDLNGDTVDAGDLSVDKFKVSAYSSDASGLLNTTTTPVSVAVKDVYVNTDGNIVLVFADQIATLTYSMYSRNLTSYEYYNIAPVSLNITKKAAETEPVVETVRPNTPSKVSVKAASKKLTISWKKVSGAKKYQIAYKKASYKTWKYVTTTKLTKTLTKLAKRTKYNVKVRAYNGRYSKWSSIKTLKTK